LFSGAAIGELAFRHIIPDYRTVGYVEWDKFCQKVIMQRIKDGHISDAPVFGDIREFNRTYAHLYTGIVDIISGGFPCQPFSVAGRRAGASDERNMWPAMLDSIGIIRPRYALLENVPGLLTTGYERRIFGDLAEIGYDCEWDIVGASDVGAPHRRKRFWCLAHAQSQ
jgi:DNA (cytosine-5)-methyltransferase 1